MTQLHQHKLPIAVHSLFTLVRTKHFILRKKENIEIKNYTVPVLMFFPENCALKQTGEKVTGKRWYVFFYSLGVKHNCPLFKVCTCMLHILPMCIRWEKLRKNWMHIHELASLQNERNISLEGVSYLWITRCLKMYLLK